MRKIFSTMMLVAAAAMTFASCQKQEINAPKTFSTTLTVNAEVATKTYLEDNTILWGTGEAVKLYFNDGEADFLDSTPTDEFDGETSASFTLELKDVTHSDSYTLGGIYPLSGTNGITNNTNPTNFKIALPATQNAESGKYDPSAFIMVMKPETVSTLPTLYTASFRRAVALNKITLTGITETILSVKIAVPEGKYLAGRRNFDLTTGESKDIYSAGGRTNEVVVNSDFAGESIDVWFTSWEVELAENEELTIQMTSATGTYTRTIAARAEGIKFLEGDLNTLTVNMASAEYVENVVDDTDYSGQWLITGVKNGQTYAAGAFVSGKTNLGETVAIEFAGDFIYDVEGLDNCVMTFTKTENGKYTIQDANDLYLYAASDSANQLKAAEGANETSYWTVTTNEDNTHSLVAVGNNRSVMQFYGNNCLFNCYATASYGAITLYPYSMVKPDTRPKLELTSESDTHAFGYEGGSATFTFELKNLEGELVVTEESDFITISKTATSVTVNAAANETSASREATVTVSCGTAPAIVLTITQEGKPAAGVSVVTDQLTGTLIGILSTSYADWNNKTSNSSAVYAGNSAGVKAGDKISIRQKSNSGIVTTTSGGLARKIVVTWHSSTAAGRTLDVYGKNDPYISTEDLSTNIGEKLGSITCGASTELAISGYYQYIGFKVATDHTIYLSEIQITWETESAAPATLSVSTNSIEVPAADM